MYLAGIGCNFERRGEDDFLARASCQGKGGLFVSLILHFLRHFLVTDLFLVRLVFFVCQIESFVGMKVFFMANVASSVFMSLCARVV